MLKVIILNNLANNSLNYNLVVNNNNSCPNNEKNENNHNNLKRYCERYYIEDNSQSHNFYVNNKMKELSDLWQVAKKSHTCVAVARLMNLWGHQNYNFLNLGHDISYLDHFERDFNFPTGALRAENNKSWYNFIKLLELSENFEREFGSHQFAPVSWLNYNGLQSEYGAWGNNPTNMDWSKPVLWLNPEKLSHTTGSGRVQVYAEKENVRCSFHSPTEGQYAVVGMSGLCITVEVAQKTNWTISRLAAIVGVLEAFGLSEDDAFDVMLNACPSCGHVIDKIKTTPSDN